jgi:hypothetical protein
MGGGIGILVKVDGNILVFDGFKVALYSCSEAFLNNLLKHIGQRIGVLRTDIEHKPYLVRTIPNMRG